MMMRAPVVAALRGALLVASLAVTASVSVAQQTKTPPDTTKPATKTVAPPATKTVAPPATKAMQPSAASATPTKAVPVTPTTQQNKSAAPSTQQPKTATPPPQQAKTVTPPPQQVKAVTPPSKQQKGAPPAQTKTVPPAQTKTVPPPTQTKTVPPPAQNKTAPAPQPNKSAPQQTKAAPAQNKTAPAPGVTGATQGQRRLNVVTTDTALAKPLIIMREVFSYDVAGRRDPFVSLLTTNDLRPTLTDLKLIMTVVDEPGRSVALVMDGNEHKQKTVTVGMKLGRMRVVSIRPNVVVFSIEAFGTNRRDSLLLRDSTKARGR
jgi:hypothetical protein